MSEYIRSITVKGWDSRGNTAQSILTFTVKAKNGKKATVKTNGHMTVKEIISAIVEAVK